MLFPGRLNLDLSLKAVLAWQVNAVLHGIVIYYVGYGAIDMGEVASTIQET